MLKFSDYGICRNVEDILQRIQELPLLWGLVPCSGFKCVSPYYGMIAVTRTAWSYKMRKVPESKTTQGRKVLQLGKQSLSSKWNSCQINIKKASKQKEGAPVQTKGFLAWVTSSKMVTLLMPLASISSFIWENNKCSGGSNFQWVLTFLKQEQKWLVCSYDGLNKRKWKGKIWDSDKLLCPRSEFFMCFLLGMSLG